MAAASAQLPEAVRTTLSEFTAAAQQAFAEDLSSVVLFGSAAKGRLRATSGINVILVLRRIDPKKLEAMKFADIIARHQVLYGLDHFIGLTISREAALRRLQQVLVNLQLRLRERYALSSAYDEQLAGRLPMPCGRCGPAPR
jgi:predicted nucleotidyltransferase